MRAWIVIVALAAAPAEAAYYSNKPCSGKKGGISHCSGKFFVCRDGTTSQSKKDCRSFGGVHDQRPDPVPKEQGRRR